VSDAPRPKRGICVYCGSSLGSDPAFGEAADALGLAVAEMGARLVFGGGARGLMGRVARATMAAGGEVVGVIPKFLQEREHATHEWSELVVVDNMHQRKQIMFDRADAFVALPGGIGTLEELVEQLTWVQLEQHRKPVVIADIAGFWGPLLALMAHMRMQEFIRDSFDAHYLVAEKIADVPSILESAWGRAERGA
jgi:uncharacterized protein (TIGR00730 family)